MSDTPRTDAAFEQAYQNNSPEFGEGWGGFADSIKLDMQKLERNLERKLADLETQHAETVGEIFRNEVVPKHDQIFTLRQKLSKLTKTKCMMEATQCKRITELERQLEETQKDTDRLEWLFQPIIPKTDKGEDAFATWHCAYGSRQAIDSAKSKH